MTLGSDLQIVAAQLPLQGLRVLVVDDDEAAREVVRSVLESDGASVETAGSSREALRQVDAWCPDVMVVDIGMPVADGFELVEELRRRPSDYGGRVPVAALTGYVSGQDRAKARRAGCQAYLTKPVEPGELTTMVKALARGEHPIDQ